MPLDGTTYHDETDPVLVRLIEGRARVAHAWCQDILRAGEAYCASGAVMGEHLNADGTWRAARDVLSRVLYKQHGVRVHTITTWNDGLGRSRHDVVALFDEAIEYRRARVMKRARVG